MLLNNFAERGIHILGHSFRIAANKKLRAVAVEPFPNFSGVIEHLVLNVNFVRLIARPCAIEPCQNAIANEFFPIFFVGVIAFLALRAEKQPGFSLRPGPLSILQERAERRDAGARPNHNERSIRIVRHVKMLGRAGINRHRNIVRPFGQKSCGHTFAQASVAFVANDVDDEVHLVRKRAQARPHRIKARLQFVEQSNEFLRFEFGRGVIE